MPGSLQTLLSLVLLLHAAASSATFCKKWGEPKNEGPLDRREVPEASGLAASLKYPGRVYWVNDSGNKSRLFHGKINGKDFKKILVSEAEFRDTEALTVTACGDDTCLIVGDVGNNKLRTRASELYLFREKDLNSDKAKPFRKVKFTFPDGPHDVEAMTALPNGDLLFITKETSLMGGTEPFVFLLTKAEWFEGSGELIARSIGKLPISKLLPDKGFLGLAVTDAAVSSQREVLGVLTYAALVEIPLEKIKYFIEARIWEKDRDFAVVPVKMLSQQETVTYMPNADRVVWSSEFTAPNTPVYSLTCDRTDY